MSKIPRVTCKDWDGPFQIQAEAQNLWGELLLVSLIFSLFSEFIFCRVNKVLAESLSRFGSLDRVLV